MVPRRSSVPGCRLEKETQVEQRNEFGVALPSSRRLECPDSLLTQAGRSIALGALAIAGEDTFPTREGARDTIQTLRYAAALAEVRTFWFRMQGEEAMANLYTERAKSRRACLARFLRRCSSSNE
jgi:hypothetical protein